MDWSISILCYNRPKTTHDCLRTVLATIPADPERVEVIVTDNGSDAEGRDQLVRLSQKHKRIRLVLNPENQGVIRPKNHALKIARAPVFVSLDNDCVVGKGWLEALTDPLRSRPELIQVGRQGGFGTLTTSGVGTRGGVLDYVDGSCFAVRSREAQELVLCDPAFKFAYCEDSDFSLRARKAGWEITLAPAVVNHFEHKTAHGTGLDLRKFWAANHKLLLARWGGYLRTRRFGHPGEPDVSPRRS